MAYKKYCNRAGCNCLIDITKRYCDKHAQTNTERNREYDRTQRNKTAKAFYNSKAWQITREKALVRDHYIDVYIYAKEKRIVKATMVHHIIELREDQDKGLDLNNLISISADTHERIIKKAYSNEETKAKMQNELRIALKQFRELQI